MDEIWVVWFIIGIFSTYLIERKEKSRIREHIEAQGWMFISIEYELFRGLGDNRIFKAWFVDEKNQLHEALFLSNFFKEVFISENKILNFEQRIEPKDGNFVLQSNLDSEIKTLREQVQKLDIDKE